MSGSFDRGRQEEQVFVRLWLAFYSLCNFSRSTVRVSFGGGSLQGQILFSGFDLLVSFFAMSTAGR